MATRKSVAQDHTPLTIAFYTPGNDSALASLHAHMGQIDWLVPSLMNVSGPKGQLAINNDPKLASLLSHAAAAAPVADGAEPVRR